jgi:His-Xaa-Ser system protein HxsD
VSSANFSEQEHIVREVKFDSAVYTVDAVKAACYRFSDKFSSLIEYRDGLIVCSLQYDAKLCGPLIDLEIENLKKEVLDQDLRQKLRTETEPVRNLILAHAFSKTGLIADE